MRIIENNTGDRILQKEIPGAGPGDPNYFLSKGNRSSFNCPRAGELCRGCLWKSWFELNCDPDYEDERYNCKNFLSPSIRDSAVEEEYYKFCYFLSERERNLKKEK